MPQELEHHNEIKKPHVGPLAEIPSLGFVTRRKGSKSSTAWRETVTQHVPESWPAARRLAGEDRRARYRGLGPRAGEQPIDEAAERGPLARRWSYTGWPGPSPGPRFQAPRERE